MANKEKAKEFAAKWKDKGNEDQDTEKFWLELLTEVYEDHNAFDHIVFQDPNQSVSSFLRKDAVINKGTDHAVLIEMKSLGIDLTKKQEQSDGMLLTPFEQAKRYDDNSSVNDKARWIITSNFRNIWIYDMSLTGRALREPVRKLELDSLYRHLDWLKCITGEITREDSFVEEVKLSKDAGMLVGELYQVLLKGYEDQNNTETLKCLNILCVRIVFCLYAEDAEIFSENDEGVFRKYLQRYNVEDWHDAIEKLFDVLDTESRPRGISPALATFPYVNGGLFKGHIQLPIFTEEAKTLIIEKMSQHFDWSKISPTIFGAIFEATLNPETRHAAGMHYTSLENIHKVIDPLFLDDLKHELLSIKALSTNTSRDRNSRIIALERFQKKLGSLSFLDPACGSGNFLTETYLCLRKLENEVISLLNNNMASVLYNPIQVSISQMYGIEVNDFAVSVARTALWIAESQMYKETKGIVNFDGYFLPLDSYEQIEENNALKCNWEDVVSPDKINYIMGNPPFLGARLMKQNGPQKQELKDVYSELSKSEVKDLDYVCGWYKKACTFIHRTNIQCAFVSTSSICQGAQVSLLFGTLMKEYKIHVNFAYQPFQWKSEATDPATVTCVIVSFSQFEQKQKYLFHSNGNKSERVPEKCKNISPYLLNTDDFIVCSRDRPICNVNEARSGNMPRTKMFTIPNETERNRILKMEPNLEKWIRVYMGADEFMTGKERYCFWLKGITPKEIQSSPILRKVVDDVRAVRLASNAKTTMGYAKTPWLFAQITQSDEGNYLLIPRHTSGIREYIPMGFMDSKIISSDACDIIPNASLFDFGVMQSIAHMAWTRTVCGRLGSGYRYSVQLVYNNFIWPKVDKDHRNYIEQTAKSILTARNKYPESSLTEMYGDKMYLFPDLIKAHKNNDHAVLEAYGFDDCISESDLVDELMVMYQKQVSGKK